MRNFKKVGFFCLACLAIVTPTSSALAAAILVLGDSLSAGYGMRQEQAWPALLQQRLVQSGKDYKVVNASISGETTAGGKARLPALLEKHRPGIVIIALGANDGLRGLPVKSMRANLTEMAQLAQTRGANPMLVGMRLPPNFGSYADIFQKAFQDVANAQKVPLAPFLLEGIADKAEYFLPDALHPNKDAQGKLLDNVWPILATLLDKPRYAAKP
jgi:acyl-CoA thioesterase I